MKPSQCNFNGLGGGMQTTVPPAGCKPKKGFAEKRRRGGRWWGDESHRDERKGPEGRVGRDLINAGGRLWDCIVKLVTKVAYCIGNALQHSGAKS